MQYCNIPWKSTWERQRKLKVYRVMQALGLTCWLDVVNGVEIEIDLLCFFEFGSKGWDYVA